MIQHKSVDLELKDIGEDGTFDAYFAAFGNVDRVGDLIEPGAFKNLEAFGSDGWVGTNHDMSIFGGVAFPLAVSQDAHGLLVRGKWHSTPDAQAVRTKVNERLTAGKRVPGSIGYKVTDSAKDRIGGKAVTRLKALDLYEVSFVNIPANPNAGAVRSKSDDSNIITLDSLRDWLDAETKAGRVLSAANHGKLKDWHDSLSAMCGQIKDMIDQHDPAKAGADGESMADPLAGKSLARLRAASLRARLSLLTPSL